MYIPVLPPLKKKKTTTIDVLRSRSWGLTLQVRKLDLELRELKSQLACGSLALEPRCWRRDEGATLCLRCAELGCICPSEVRLNGIN